VIAGNYSVTQPILLPRLTDIVWIDPPGIGRRMWHGVPGGGSRRG